MNVMHVLEKNRILIESKKFCKQKKLNRKISYRWHWCRCAKITYRLKLQDTTLMWLPFGRFTTVSTQLEAEARNYCKKYERHYRKIWSNFTPCKDRRHVYNDLTKKCTQESRKKYISKASEATRAGWPRHSLPTTRAHTRTAADNQKISGNRCGQHC